MSAAHILAGLILILAISPKQAWSQAPNGTDPYAELQDLCNEDAERLWGVSLCGPLLVVDPETRAVWASEADGEGVLTPGDNGWTGQLPAGVGVANTTMEWAGQRWIMVMAPLPQARTERRALLAHEAWHRIQGQLGLSPAASDCVHLEQERARVLLRLEFRALATALRSRGRARASAARSALIYRTIRLSEFPTAIAQESALDRNEGLASYTGVRLGAGDAADSYAAQTLDNFDRHEAYARSYAYASGPAYGLILDRIRPDWRRELGLQTPADMLAAILMPNTGDARILIRADARYGASSIAAEERVRADAQRARIAELRSRFTQGPRLVIPLSNMQIEFNPNQVTPVEGLGSIYQVLTIRDRFGELHATQGALISSTFTQVILPEPAPNGLSGPGWTLAPAATAQIGSADETGARHVSVP